LNLESPAAPGDTVLVERGPVQLQFFFRGGRKRISGGRAAGRAARKGLDRELSRRAAEHCLELGLSGLSGRVRVYWNGRMRSTAGRATWPEGAIELNPALEEISALEVERTLLHELAHLVAYERSGRRRIRPHGPEWRRACAELGIAGERAGHRLPLPARTMRPKWRYVCPGCWTAVERVRRMRGRTACYACCRRFNRGRYDERFRFIERRLG